jgi:hypothetical protein
MHQTFLDRLSIPHESLTETSQLYSTFNSTYAQATYEEQMVKASKVAARSSTRWDAREPWERGWVSLCQASSDDAEAQAAHREQKVGYLYAYLEMEMSTFDGRKPEPKMVQAVYERWLEVLSEDTKREGRAAEAAVWDRYITYIVRHLNYLENPYRPDIKLHIRQQQTVSQRRKSHKRCNVQSVAVHTLVKCGLVS